MQKREASFPRSSPPSSPSSSAASSSAFSGQNPLSAYAGILDGAGVNWLWDHFGNTSVLDLTTFNLTQTLLRTTTFVLTGLAVAFAFRCGLFNIGGQGQYTMGIVAAIRVGATGATSFRTRFTSSSASRRRPGRRDLGGDRRLPEGDRRPRGDHDDHAQLDRVLVRELLLRPGRAAAEPVAGTGVQPISERVPEVARDYPGLWGNQGLQALHYGIFLALAALVVFSIVLNRTTLGYEVRAVGFNPEAAAYGGISVKKNFFLAMAISGLFAGLAAGIDIFGWKYSAGVLDVQASTVGLRRHRRRAPRTLDRRRRRPRGLLFAALDYGTTRGLDPDVFDPTLAGNLSLMIQGLVVLFVGADLLILYLWSLRKKRFATPRMSGKGV